MKSETVMLDPPPHAYMCAHAHTHFDLIILNNEDTVASGNLTHSNHLCRFSLLHILEPVHVSLIDLMVLN